MQRSLRTDVQEIELAIEGRRDLLEAIFGEPPKQKTPITPDQMKAFSRRHNRVWAAQKEQQGRKRRQGQ